MSNTVSAADTGLPSDKTQSPRNAQEAEPTFRQKIEDVRRQFAAEGITIKEWAEDCGYSVSTVYAIMGGRIRCTRGVAHRIAVDLGLKAEPRQRIFSQPSRVRRDDMARQEGARA